MWNCSGRQRALEGRGLGSGEVFGIPVDSSYALIKGIRPTDFRLPARAKVTAYGYQRLMYEVTCADPFLLAELTTAPSSPFLHAVGRSQSDSFTRFHVAVENERLRDPGRQRRPGRPRHAAPHAGGARPKLLSIFIIWRPSIMYALCEIPRRWR